MNDLDSFKKVSLIIDFTVPKCTFEVLKIAEKLKKKVVIGTTGFSKKEEELIKKFYSDETPEQENNQDVDSLETKGDNDNLENRSDQDNLKN